MMRIFEKLIKWRCTCFRHWSHCISYSSDPQKNSNPPQKKRSSQPKGVQSLFGRFHITRRRFGPKPMKSGTVDYVPPPPHLLSGFATDCGIRIRELLAKGLGLWCNGLDDAGCNLEEDFILVEQRALGTLLECFGSTRSLPCRWKLGSAPWSCSGR